MRASEIRRAFLDFFRERGHRIVPSSSLIPDHPRAPLLTTAGMVQFIPYFLGEKPIEFPRAASCQKSARTTDIEVVGLTARHQTLFEMLGNFSFGDYYKREAITWAWELSTTHLGLDPERIWVTVYEQDDEAVAIWRDEVGFPAERIVRRGKDDNFWWMGVAGPGGPCSEMFYDRGPAYGEVDGFQDGDRIMEYYNLVFTEFEVDDQGEILGPLPRKNVDTGMGLERITQIVQDVASAYETDLLRPILARAEALTGRTYGADAKADISLRIIAEHSRATAFLVGDGILPSNEGRGYVLRRLVRRAIRHAKLLGVDDPIMPEMIDSVVATLGDAYPELVSGKAFITQVAGGEEEGFRHTLRSGLSSLEEEISGASREGRTAVSGDAAFRLHDTYGFPFELTLEIAADAGLQIDRDRFEELMEQQRERGRASRVADEDRGATAAARDILGRAGASRFVGYAADHAEARVVGLIAGGSRVVAASEGDEIEVVLDTTPFYPEGGGQVGDSGLIEVGGAILEIVDTQRRLDDLIVHQARVKTGEVSEGAAAMARVDLERRAATQRSHSATHILHATLRAALGEHARQAGSLVEPGRLRFDFPHFQAVPREVLDEVEAIVNARLVADDPVRPYETTMEEAQQRGAMMLFEEKYGDIVRVVEIGDYSTELCGGTHVTHTSEIGVVKILGEGSIGSNIRRVEALTGTAAIEDFRRSRAVLDHIAALLRSTPAEAPARVEKLLADLKAAEAQVRKVQGASVAGRAAEIAQTASTVGSTALVVASVPGLAMGELQKLAVAVRDKVSGNAAVILAGDADGKAAIVAAVRGLGDVNASELIAAAARAIGGGAGGRGELATGGGSKPEGIGDALRVARETAQERLA